MRRDRVGADDLRGWKGAQQRETLWLWPFTPSLPQTQRASRARRVDPGKTAGAPAPTEVRDTVFRTLLNQRAGSVQSLTQGQPPSRMDRGLTMWDCGLAWQSQFPKNPLSVFCSALSGWYSRCQKRSEPPGSRGSFLAADKIKTWPPWHLQPMINERGKLMI